MPAPEPILEVFIETAWNEDARTQRDERADLLSQQGYECACETLYNGLNQRVFLVRAELPEIEPVADLSKARKHPQGTEGKPKLRKKVRDFMRM